MGKVKVIKKIRRYAKLRGAKDPRINEKTLRIVWDRASPETKKKFEQEMDRYFKLVESGKIEAGDSPISMLYNTEKSKPVGVTEGQPEG